jgi:hypothetical protein
MSSDQYGPGYGQGGPGYGPPPGGQGGPGYGPPSGAGGPGYGPGPGGPGYGPGPGGPGYGPGANPYGGQPPQGAGGYPVKVHVEYPQKLSRLLIFVKGLLAIPHFFALLVLGICAYFVTIIAWFAILFTGRYPRGLFDFTSGLIRWQTRVSSYLYLLTDAYPPFSLQDE